MTTLSTQDRERLEFIRDRLSADRTPTELKQFRDLIKDILRGVRDANP